MMRIFLILVFFGIFKTTLFHILLLSNFSTNRIPRLWVIMVHFCGLDLVVPLGEPYLFWYLSHASLVAFIFDLEEGVLFVVSADFSMYDFNWYFCFSSLLIKDNIYWKLLINHYMRRSYLNCLFTIFHSNFAEKNNSKCFRLDPRCYLGFRLITSVKKKQLNSIWLHSPFNI